MNQSDARAIGTRLGYVGEFRLVWKASYQPVLRTDEKGRKLGPQYFASADAAECAAWRAKNALETSVMTRDGEQLARRSAAEALFKPTVKQRGKERHIPVEVRV